MDQDSIFLSQELIFVIILLGFKGDIYQSRGCLSLVGWAGASHKPCCYGWVLFCWAWLEYFLNFCIYLGLVWGFLPGFPFWPIKWMSHGGVSTRRGLSCAFGWWWVYDATARGGGWLPPGGELVMVWIVYCFICLWLFYFFIIIFVFIG